MPQTITTFDTVPAALLALYRQVHAAGLYGGSGAAAAVMHMDADFTFVAAGAKAQEPSLVLTLAVGPGRTAREFFRGATPTPAELEGAMAAVEDELQAAHPHWRAAVSPDGLEGAAPTVWCADAELRALAPPSGAPAQMTAAPRNTVVVLHRDTVEQLSRRLAATTEGRAAPGDALPQSDPAWAARLVVLRELMHHWSIPTLALLPERA